MYREAQRTENTETARKVNVILPGLVLIKIILIQRYPKVMN